MTTTKLEVNILLLGYVVIYKRTNKVQKTRSLENAFTIVQEKALSIKHESEGVQTSMEQTRNITFSVVTAIEKIGQGTAGISDSMNRVSVTSNKLGKTGDNLKSNTDRFKTE